MLDSDPTPPPHSDPNPEVTRTWNTTCKIYTKHGLHLVEPAADQITRKWAEEHLDISIEDGMEAVQAILNGTYDERAYSEDGDMLCKAFSVLESVLSIVIDGNIGGTLNVVQVPPVSADITNVGLLFQEGKVTALELGIQIGKGDCPPKPVINYLEETFGGDGMRFGFFDLMNFEYGPQSLLSHEMLGDSTPPPTTADDQLQTVYELWNAEQLLDGMIQIQEMTEMYKDAVQAWKSMPGLIHTDQNVAKDVRDDLISIAIALLVERVKEDGVIKPAQ